MTDPTYSMLDDVNVALLERYAAPADAVAGYVNGSYANWDEIVAKYETSKHLVSIDVQANPRAGAQTLDIENGDATTEDAPGWTRTTRKNGLRAGDLRRVPKLYTSESNLQNLVAVMEAAGIKRESYLLWSAHYTYEPHICGPDSCGSPVQADATQWTDKFQGVSLDASLCFERFFLGKPVPPKRKPVKHDRHVADGSKSLEDLAAEAKTTVPEVLKASAEKLSHAHLRELVDYLAVGTKAKAPKGLVFWTAV